MDWMELLRTSWPILIAIVSLIIILAKMHADIQVLKEKVATLFQLWNKLNGKSDK